MSSFDLKWVGAQFPELQDLQPLGPGGQKFVLAARHPSEGDVVLKLFKVGSEEETVIREGDAPSRVESARVPQIFEIGTVQSPVGEIYWIREQRVHGISLRDSLKAGRLPHQQVLRLARHVTEALHAAEVARIVHRDVKPDNIIAADGGDYWLIDFGIARHLDLHSITATVHAFGKGTPGYMPPEQIRNLKPAIDSRADLFALGLTLYEAVEGTNPLREGARDELEMFRRTERLSLPPISKDIDGRGEFAKFVLSLTRAERNHRLRTVAQALEWIDEICGTAGIPS